MRRVKLKYPLPRAFGSNASLDTEQNNMYDPNDPKTMFHGLEFTIEEILNNEDVLNDLNDLGSTPKRNNQRDFDAGTFYQIVDDGVDGVNVWRMEKNDEWDPNDDDSLEYIAYEGDGFYPATMEFDSHEAAKEYLDSLGKWIEVY